ncbi:MAG: hypothetical protein Q4C54_10455 [Clostridia bacterium]|nr:hypothetical protein [Clostridia bacterium]
MKLLKLIPKILVAPAILIISIVYVTGNVLAAASSIVTNLVGTVFIFGAVCGWMTHAREETVWMIAISGIVFLLLPLFIKGLLEGLLRINGILMKIMAW